MIHSSGLALWSFTGQIFFTLISFFYQILAVAVIGTVFLVAWTILFLLWPRHD